MVVVVYKLIETKLGFKAEDIKTRETRIYVTIQEEYFWIFWLSFIYCGIFQIGSYCSYNNMLWGVELIR